MSQISSASRNRRIRLAVPFATLLFGVASCSHDSTAPALPVATQLTFTAPPVDGIAAGIEPEIDVTAEDASGSAVKSFTGGITLAFGANPGGSTLSGTLTVSAVAGTARFTNISLNKLSAGYTLFASTGALQSAPSDAFTITAPVSVPGFTSIAVGYLHTCALTAAGAAYCWGYNGVGQLGDGTTTTRHAPVRVAGAVAFSSLAVANTAAVTCGLTADGTAYCWGLNAYGELGDGTTTNRLTPVAVQGGLTFTTLVAGATQTCGIATSGTTYCWGGNSNGELGDGTAIQRLVPASVEGGLSFASLAAGTYLTCGRTSAGAAYCWGINQFGEVGDGTMTPRLTPAAVSGGFAFTSLTADNSHSCGLTAVGAAYCWGQNADGEVGDATTTGRVAPSAVQGGLTFSTLMAGGYFTCGLTAGGAAYCWGQNAEGALADSTSTGSLTPVAVHGGLAFTSVSAGTHNACGLTAAGKAYCWGYDGDGEIGNGVAGPAVRVPTAVTP